MTGPGRLDPAAGTLRRKPRTATKANGERRNLAPAFQSSVGTARMHSSGVSNYDTQASSPGDGRDTNQGNAKPGLARFSKVGFARNRRGVGRAPGQSVVARATDRCEPSPKASWACATTRPDAVARCWRATIPVSSGNPDRGPRVRGRTKRDQDIRDGTDSVNGPPTDLGLHSGSRTTTHPALQSVAAQPGDWTPMAGRMSQLRTRGSLNG